MYDLPRLYAKKRNGKETVPQVGDTDYDLELCTAYKAVDTTVVFEDRRPWVLVVDSS